jgi:hypothetical protein
MRCRNRFWQCSLKLAIAAALMVLNGLVFAQNEPAAVDPAVNSPSTEASASSVASSAPSEKPLYADTVERDNALLVKAFTAVAKADELQWLETPDEKILSLYKAGETRKTKGVLLIMHAPESPQLWPTNLENLRSHLPLSGWATMALPLPAKYPTAIPERESSSASSVPPESTEAAAASPAPAEPVTTAPSSSASSAKPVVARDKLIAGRVDAAVAQLNKLGQFNIVLLVDNSSAPDTLAGLYKKISTGTTTGDTVDGPLQALVLVNLQDQEPLSKEQLAAIFSVSALPVMDVFFRVDDGAQKELRRKHQAEAMRKDLKDYQQLILPTQPPVMVNDPKSFWLTKVHGFMERKAEGNEVKGK